MSIQNHQTSPYSPNQFHGWDFFAASYSKTALMPEIVLLIPKNSSRYQLKGDRTCAFKKAGVDPQRLTVDFSTGA